MTGRMPYPVAHAAAAIALAPLLGRAAVPSALVIGTVVPDAWYLLPLLERSHSHTVEGLFLFCLPIGLLIYIAFHLAKQPLLALVPEPLASRLAAYATPELPRVSWLAVALCIVAGAWTHMVWDDFTGDEEYGRIVRHASTLLGGAFVAAWTWRKLQRARPAALPERFSLPPLARRRLFQVIFGCSALAAIASAWMALPSLPPSGYESARLLARTAGIDALSVVVWLLVCYGLVRRLR
jgi:hypothetical protein